MSSLTSFKESVAVQNNALPRAADDGAADAAMAVPLSSLTIITIPYLGVKLTGSAQQNTTAFLLAKNSACINN